MKGELFMHRATGLHVVVEPGEMGYFVASCVELRGCYSQGASVEEALKNISDAIQEMLEVMKEEGVEPQLPAAELAQSGSDFLVSSYSGEGTVYTWASTAWEA